jgi:hypothetical protein
MVCCIRHVFPHEESTRIEGATDHLRQLRNFVVFRELYKSDVEERQGQVSAGVMKREMLRTNPTTNRAASNKPNWLLGPASRERGLTAS